MKLAICSDLHLEFGDLVLKNTDGADVLILSGDICIANTMNADPTLYSYSSAAEKRQRYIDFFVQVCREFKDVIYVMGNHEHYHGDFAKSAEYLKTNLDFIKNLHILENEVKVIDDVTFIGGTLWTDFNNEDEVTLMQIRRMMNDFQCVKNSGEQIGYWSEHYAYNTDGSVKRDEQSNPIVVERQRHYRDSQFTPYTALEDHRAMLGLVLRTVDADPNGKFVVVGHHAPSRQSTHPRYMADEIMNGGYSSRLDFIIEDRPQIKVWTHGHTHEPFDYEIGGTRIVCNPRGYIGHEIRADEFELKYVDV